MSKIIDSEVVTVTQGSAPGTTTDKIYNVGGTLYFNGTALGAGGLTNFAEAVNTSAPNATIPVVSLTATNAATNVDFAILPKGTGAILADIPDNTSAGGNKRGAYAVDMQIVRSANTMVSSGDYSYILGGKNNRAANDYSGVLGGENNSNISQHSVVMGKYGYATKAGQFVIGQGIYTTLGRNQISFIPMAIATTNATETEILCNTSGTIDIPSGACYSFTVTITGRKASQASWCVSYKRYGLISNDGGTTALEGAVQTLGTDIENSNMTGCTCTITADNTNDRLKITVTGLAGTNISWTAMVELTEVGA